MNMEESSLENPNDADLSVVHDGGFFSLHRGNTETQIVRKLEKLRDDNFPTEIDFTVEGILWTQRISQEIIQTFEHYASAGRQWNDASFYDLEPDDSNANSCVDAVLQAAMRTKIFRGFTFSNELTVERPMSSQFATTLANVLKNNERNVGRVTIENFAISNVAMSHLAQGLVTDDSGSAARYKLELHYSRFEREEDGEVGDDQDHEDYDNKDEDDDEGVDDDEDDGQVRNETRRGAGQYLAEGLARNKTLTSFIFCGCNQSDSIAGLVVQSLVDHESLSELQLSHVEFGETTISSIFHLLASPTCKLSDLHMSDHVQVSIEGDAEFNLQTFVQHLQRARNNTSLESLTISEFNFDHSEANQLLRILWKFPNLRSLDLSNNSMSGILRLGDDATIARPPSRLRILDIDDNNLDLYLNQAMDESYLADRNILHLLEVFPELGYLGEDFADAIERGFFPASVAERIDLNWYSGLLLRGHGATIPLSVWPVVMAKVNSDSLLDDTSPRKANVFYHMLQGPAFVGRGAFDR